MASTKNTPAAPAVALTPAPALTPSSMSTKQLVEMRKAITLELRKRAEAQLAKRPANGAKVLIEPSASKRWAGQEGVVLMSGRTRVFVQVGSDVANLPLAQVTQL